MRIREAVILRIMGEDHTDERKEEKDIAMGEGENSEDGLMFNKRSDTDDKGR